MDRKLRILLFSVLLSLCSAYDSSYFLDVDILSEGPAVDFKSLYKEYSILFNGAIILIGCIQAFVGYKSIKASMFALGAIVGFIPSLIGSLNILSSKIENPTTLIWTAIGISALVGLLVGVLFMFLFQVGYFVIGAALGAVTALYLVVGLDCLLRIHNMTTLFVAMGGFGLMCGVFAVIWEKVMVIWASSFVGAYLIVYGVGTFVGNWLDPLAPAFYVNIIVPPWEWWLYIGLLIVLSLAGVIVQFVVNRGPPKEIIFDLEEQNESLIEEPPKRRKPVNEIKDPSEVLNKKTKAAAVSTTSTAKPVRPVGGKGGYSKAPGAKTGNKPRRKNV